MVTFAQGSLLRGVG